MALARFTARLGVAEQANGRHPPATEDQRKEMPVSELMKTMTLGAVLYEGFELLDLYGPLEMFGNLKPSVQIVTVAQKVGAVASFQGPKTVAEVDFETCPTLDLLLVPGGMGTLAVLKNPAMLEFLRKRALEAKITMSVCSGTWLLAKAGLLDGRRATSNKMLVEVAVQLTDKVTWIPEARWVEDGPFWTSSGVSAGMDMALGVVAKLFGEELAQTVANGAEYSWQSDPAIDPFHRFLNHFPKEQLDRLAAAAGR